MTRWRDQHALITGGSSGIGLSLAKALADEGARLTLWARGQQRLDAAASQLRAGGAEVEVASVDVTDPRAVGSAYAAAVARQGPVDLLITSAGVARPGHFLELDESIFREMMEVDYFGTLAVLRPVVSDMVARRHGHIVGVSSGAALVGLFGYSAYGPAKFAVRGLFESLRDELPPHGVGVHCVFPADVDTPQLVEENRFKPRETAAISGTVKPMHPDEVALAVLRGVEKGRFAIYPNREMAALGRVMPLVAPLFQRFVDRQVRRSRATEQD